MIRWLHREDGEGRFHSSFFRNGENEDELIVYANSENPDLWNAPKNVLNPSIISPSL